MRSRFQSSSPPAARALDALLAQAEAVLVAGGMAVELAAAVVELARKGAGAQPSISSGPSGRMGAAVDRIAEAERLWSTREVAAYLDVHERTVLRHIDAGRLRGTRVGRRHRFRQADVDAFLARAITRHEHGALNAQDSVRDRGVREIGDATAGDAA